MRHGPDFRPAEAGAAAGVEDAQSACILPAGEAEGIGHEAGRAVAEARKLGIETGRKAVEGRLDIGVGGPGRDVASLAGREVMLRKHAARLLVQPCAENPCRLVERAAARIGETDEFQREEVAWVQGDSLRPHSTASSKRSVESMTRARLCQESAKSGSSAIALR